MRLSSLLLASTPVRRDVVRAQECGGQQIERLLPMCAVTVEPDGSGKDGAGVEAAPADTSGSLLVHQTSAHQDVDMAGYRLQRDIERRREFGDKQLLLAKACQYGAPHRVAQSEEHLVEQRRLFVCHLTCGLIVNGFVDDRARSTIC